MQYPSRAQHAEIFVDLWPSAGFPTKVPFRMAGAKQSHLKVESKMPWKWVHRYVCIIRDSHIFYQGAVQIPKGK